jgi:hypothetical protein
MTQVGIAAGKFSPKGLIPPAITGLHNGDVIREWMANGITMVVGDNTRPPLLNTVRYLFLFDTSPLAVKIYGTCANWTSHSKMSIGL